LQLQSQRGSRRRKSHGAGDEKKDKNVLADFIFGLMIAYTFAFVEIISLLQRI
jgi:hypothetical protein